MFYVSNISGAQTPYDYRTTPISKRIRSAEIAAADPISSINSESQLEEVPRKQLGREAYREQIAVKARKQVIYAEEIMSNPVFTLLSTERLSEASKAFKKFKFRHIPIVNESFQLVGILSDRDLFSMLSGATSQDLQIGASMTTQILTARPKAEIREIASLMITRRIGCVPITDETGDLQGILTRSDILRTIVNHAPIELWS